ncbi:MAG: hypothetical protein A3K60_02465 [Euryarchaeota archaeon RBG_19FT_COMBO_56_21]|nr:MAG: hypothetical protein A3K60_02465 [Euryarchaeota archaeon RBG_19FT_COMBO_56_21]
MHVPDGLMDPLVALIGLLEFLAFITAASYLGSKRLQDKQLPRIALLSAGIFVAQMLNFPIGGGTTGHLIGAALFAILVGPALAVVGMTVVLIIQALMFGDGGITSFGLNAINMAVIAPLTGWGVYHLLEPMLGRSGISGKNIAVGAAAWASVFVAAAACAAELAVSYAISGGAYGIAATVSIPAMLGYHAVIGVGEAVITVGVIAYLWDVSADSFLSKDERLKNRAIWGRITSSKTLQASLAVLVVFALALPLYFLYSSEGMDGLERTMDDAGIEEENAMLASPFGYGESYFAVLFAGVIGFVAVALIALGLLRAIGSTKFRE